jgi:hypothetical protein
VRFPQIAFVFFLVALTAFPLFAQSPNGTVNGLVLDPSNRAISGADILVINDVTGVKYSSKTNDEGIYVVPSLPPGPYRLQVSKAGFKMIIKPDIVLFAKHQLNYLADIVRVLFYTGLKFNFYDVLVMAMDERVMKEQVEKARKRIALDSSLPTQRRLNFEMSIRNLYASLRDRERVQKIQGLLNECMTFLDDQLSVLTGPYEQLLSLDDVIDQELILVVSLNINKNPEPMRSLGKMLLQNLQLVIGKRYESEEHRLRAHRPMLSVVLDEFAPFGYRNFAQILQTARGTNTAFLFSMQALPQLMQVDRGFKEDVSSAPNTTMILRTRDEETTRYFLRASAEHRVARRSVSMHRWRLFGFETYTQTEGAVDHEEKETRALDEHIKNLPKAQMEILMTDDARGTLHSLLHVRAPEDVRVPRFKPQIYATLRQPREDSTGANLRFKTPELVAVGRRRRAGGCM